MSDDNWNGTYSCLTCRHGKEEKTTKGFICTWYRGDDVYHNLDIGRGGCDYWMNIVALHEYKTEHTKIKLFGSNISELINQIKFWWRKWK